MKKILTLIILSLFITSVNAMNPADWLKKIPDNFKSECYQNYNKIDKSKIWNNQNARYKTYKIDINKTKDLVITQYGFILPYKYYSNNKLDIYNYSNSLWINNKYLLDFNKNTYKEINSKTQNTIILKFEKKLEKDNFSFVFNYQSDNYYPEYFISNDWNNWDKIKKQDIKNFSFNYLKIYFKSKIKENYLENIKIYELNFIKKSNTILVKSMYNSDIEIYSNFDCKIKDFNTAPLNYDNFYIDSNTKIIEIKSSKNPKYNVYFKKDFDNDWVEDEVDNCKYTYNPNQADTNWDWIWDVCSDIDKDWIKWEYDNCPNIYNPDQKDINRNWVWDICEFDKDKDSIFDKLDNCINKYNPDQKDIDGDWIWDVCDNSIYFNPSQLDTNNNWIWDITEKKEKQLKENDKDKDWIIDFKDNCINKYNSEQKDIDKDWIWDVCDNCVNYQNKNQLDYNKNSVWDICEDSDNDGIEWITDNCINIYNPDQKDDDNNWVWNICEDKDGDKILAVNDNCPYNYNPDQKDIDKDWAWDICDKKDNRYIESNSNFFIWLLIFIVLIFWWWIFIMIKKLK